MSALKVGDRVRTQIANPAVWTEEAGRILNGITGTISEIFSGRDARGEPEALYRVTFDAPVARSWSAPFTAFHYGAEDLAPVPGTTTTATVCEIMTSTTRMGLHGSLVTRERSEWHAMIGGVSVAAFRGRDGAQEACALLDEVAADRGVAAALGLFAEIAEIARRQDDTGQE